LKKARPAGLFFNWILKDMEPWTSFWEHGHTTTFGAFFRDGYDGAIKSWWHRILDDIIQPIDVLDIGCGNGALLLDLLDQNINGSYTGIDLASVKLSQVAKQKLKHKHSLNAQLKANTNAEALPIDSASMDLVVSVFGIEYSDLQKSLPEAIRTLKVGAPFHALMHADESVISSMSARALGEFQDDDMAAIVANLNTIDQQLNELRVPAKLKQSRVAEAARTRLNALAQKYMSNLNPETGNAIMVQFVGDALKYFKMINQSDTLRQKYIAGLSAEFETSRQRYRSMAAAAQDQAEIEQVENLLHTQDCTSVSVEKFFADPDQKELAGWHIFARK
jgi:ubiquinone/menaquinone biosynthesis C-methylase UbiE